MRYTRLPNPRPIGTRDPLTAEWLRSNVHETDAGCWEWLGAAAAFGHGSVSHKGKMLRVHRVMYELVRGPIPDGLVIDHLCRNPPCCNPDHLETVTQAENMRRGANKKFNGVDCYRCGSTDIVPDGTTFRCRACARVRDRLRRSVGKAAA